jgi:cell division protein FtsI (penicillin-binding protein 3)
MRYAASPMLASKTPPWRSTFVVGLVGLSFCVLAGRAFYVQVTHRTFYQEQGANRYERKLDLPANRGRILDRNGLLLASSVPMPSVWAVPKDLEADGGQRQKLAQLLGYSRKELDERLSDNPNFVWLRRQADDKIGDGVKKLALKGIFQTTEFKREYPEGEAVAHVVGFTDVEDRGQEGVELAFQRQLAGRSGERNVIKDRLGRVVDDLGGAIAAVDGEDLALSIDSKMQYFAYQQVRDAVLQHRAKAGSAVVLDVKTGEVLALTNYPSYSPAARGKMGGEQVRNRALTDTFEPGSTVKPFVVASALDSKLVTPYTVIDAAPGRMMMAGHMISDSHMHGPLTVQEVIQKSSNVGVTKIALQMPPRQMWEMFTSVGMGQKPQVEFPGAVSGRLRPYKTWRPIEQATMSYGYGLSVSLFQLAQAYTVFARDGQMVPATLIKGGGARTGVQVMSPQTAQEVRHMLQMVTEEGGTAPRAQTQGYSVGGKTGTAHKQEGDGYADKKYRSWFVGLAPVKNPRIVVAVMVDEPGDGKYFGGDVAAPVFSEVVQQSLRMMGVPPDLEVKPQIMARSSSTNPVAESF